MTAAIVIVARIACNAVVIVVTAAATGDIAAAASVVVIVRVACNTIVIVVAAHA